MTEITVKNNLNLRGVQLRFVMASAGKKPVKFIKYRAQARFQDILSCLHDNTTLNAADREINASFTASTEVNDKISVNRTNIKGNVNAAARLSPSNENFFISSLPLLCRLPFQVDSLSCTRIFLIKGKSK
jgi:hypothetical protein